MKRNFALVVASLVVVATCASAKDPRALKPATLMPAIEAPTGSLTPPPKEWAMFPQDEPPAQAAQAPQQTGQKPAASNAGATGATSGGERMGSMVSAPNARPVQARELPLFWLLLTGALSLGAISACGSLILRKEVENQDADESDSDAIPIVPEHLEVKA